MRSERTAVYSAALLQGAVLVTYAAYSGILVNKHYYALTPAEYGDLFVPQVLTVVIAALASAALGRRFSTRQINLAGAGCSLTALALLVATEWTETAAGTYPLLLASTAFVGAGFGLSFPSLLSYAEGLSPLNPEREILLVNALLAAGMAAAPVVTWVMVRIGLWGSLPVLLAVPFLAVEVHVSRSLPGPARHEATRPPPRRVHPRFWAYPALALLYGFCAVMCVTLPPASTGNGAHPQLTFTALVEGSFWAALVVISRVVFALADTNESWRAASLAAYAIFALIILVGVTLPQYDLAQVGLYLLAALGCAALLPLDVRPGSEHMAVLPLAVTGGIAALFPIALGLARPGLEAVERGGMTRSWAFIALAVAGAGLSLLLWPAIRSWPGLGRAERPAAARVPPADRR